MVSITKLFGTQNRYFSAFCCRAFSLAILGRPLLTRFGQASHVFARCPKIIKFSLSWSFSTVSVFRKLAVLPLLACSFLLFSAEKIPFVVDFGSKQFENHFFQEEFSSELIQSAPFNGAVEMSTFFKYLKSVYHIHVAVETGTYLGQTTMFLGSLFDETYTIEVSPEYYAKSKAFLISNSNVQVYLGDSPQVLKKILPRLKGEPVVFYLDAHWYNQWPLLDELTEISKTHRDNCVVVIDDFKVPGRPDIAFDSYNGKACSYEYIKKKLSEVFSDCSIHYLIPKNINARAKFVAIPKAWMKHPKRT